MAKTVYNLGVPFDRAAGNYEQQRQGRSPPGEALPADAVRSELEKILSSQAFVHSPQLCRFLRFAVEKAIGGEGDQLKEFLVGVEVFHKDESFDQRIDTVVRTEARRLRHKLREYYQTEGQTDTIEIDLPKGSYCPSFRARSGVLLPPVAPSPVSHTRKLFLAAGAFLTIAGIGAYWAWTRGGETNRGRGRAPAIAVLPLENLSADPEQEYFSDGMTDALITNLAKISGLRVISRTSVLQHKRAKKPIREIARQLGVEYVVEGTVVRSGDRVRITVQLIAAAPSERHLWAESYERGGSDVFALQGELARAIAGKINIQVTPREQARLATRPVSREAYEAYLKGRFYRHPMDMDRARKSIEFFGQAIEKEPNYALAYAGLADSYAAVAFWNELPRRNFVALARANALKALDLDDSLGEAHTTLGSISRNYDWDWTEAERRFRRALELSPNYAPAHQLHAVGLAATGRFEEALAEARRARELDPLAPMVNAVLGKVLSWARHYDQAIQQLRQTLEMHPDFFPALLYLGMTYEAKGMHGAAIDVLQKASTLTGGAPAATTQLAHAHAGAGNRRETQRLLDSLEKRSDVSPVALALLYMDLGDKDLAFEWLEKGYEQRSAPLEYLKVNPVFDRFRADPRFTALLKKMNLAN